MAGYFTKSFTDCNRQPSNARKLNPKYSSGLVLATEFQHGGKPKDLKGLTVTTNGTSDVKSGLKVNLVNGTNYLSWGNPASIQFTNTSDWTMLSLFFIAGGVNTLRMLMAKDNGASPRPLFHFRVEDTNTIGAVFGHTSNTLGSLVGSTAIGTAADYGQKHCAAFRRRAGTSLALFLDGKVEKSGADGSTGTWTITTGDVASRYEAANNAQTNGWHALDLIWNRALSDSDLLELTRNPWAIYEPEESQIWVPVAAGGGTTITGSPVNFQWETNAGSFKQKVETTPVNWNWFVTSGTVTENIKFTPVNFQWEVTSGSIQQGSATTITTTPVTWQWEQSSASFVTRIQSSPVNFQWESTASNIKEYVNSVPVTFQWQLTSGSILGTTAIDFNAGVWEWEITTGSISYVQPAQTSGTIGGKKDKHLKLPFYDKGKKYDSRIDLDEVYQPAKSKLDDPVADRDLVGVDVRSDKHIDGDIDVRQDIKSDEPGGRLVSELLQEIKGQSQPVSVNYGSTIEFPAVAGEPGGFFENDSSEEAAVIMLLLAA